MEILIVGAVVVALMVFISTKIKKSVAAAFEREIIENENFRLIKPAGFINPINENSEFAFEAYTKEFGKNDADEFRQASAHVTVISGSDFKTAIESVKKNRRKILSEEIFENAVAKQKICLLESETIAKNVPARMFDKIIEAERQSEIYHLQVVVIDAYAEAYAERIKEMIESFAVK